MLAPSLSYKKASIVNTGRASVGLIVLGCLLAALIFYIDLSLPLGVAGGVPYAGIVLIGLWSRARTLIFALALLGTALTVLGYLYSPAGSEQWVVITNRGLALVLIWSAAVIAVAHNIKQDSIRRMLKEREASLVNAQRIAKVGSWEHDLGTGDIAWSAETYSIYGRDPAEFEPTIDSIVAAVHPDDREVFAEVRQHAIEGQDSHGFQNEFRIVRPDGSRRDVFVQAEVSRDKSGKPLQISGTAQDITESKRAEEELLILSRAIEQSPTSVMITDTEGKLEYVNPKFTEMTGYASDEVIGKTPRILKSDHTPPEEYERLWRIITKGGVWTGEFHNVRKDGSEFWESASISGVKGADGKIIHYLAFKEDITERKKSEQTLVESEERFRTAFESVTVGSIVIDNSGVIESINAMAQRIFRYKSEDIIGKNIKLLMPEPYAISHDGYIQAYLDTGDPKIIGIGREVIGLRKNGDKFPMHLGVGEMRVGGHQMFIGTISDLSEIKALEEQLSRSQKLEVVGQLSGGIAHDFNNILGIVQGNLEFLERMFGDDPKALKRIETALRGTKRGARLTRSLLDFSMTHAQASTLTSVNEFIQNMEELITMSATAGIAVETNLGEELWPVKIDPGDLEDAILNLALNARDAMPDGGTLIIETANKVLDEHSTRHNPGAKAGEFVMVSVSDTGIGMTAEVKEKLFEPFFTTKEKSGGSGLGLSMVYGFVQRSGGQINVYSEEGQGTSFRIYLPRTLDEEEESAAEKTAPERLPRGKETILVIDDEEQLAEVAVLHLEDLGYRTITSHNPKEALKVLRGKQKIDLLFSDVVMPGGLDGYRLAIDAIKKRPALKVVLTSGFTKKRETYTSEKDAIYAKLSANLLDKPYSQAELARAVRRALDED